MERKFFWHLIFLSAFVFLSASCFAETPLTNIVFKASQDTSSQNSAKPALSNESSITTLNMEFYLPEYELIKEGDYTEVFVRTIAKEVSYLEEPDKPNLPYFTFYISVPPDTKVKGVRLDTRKDDVVLDSPIKPAYKHTDMQKGPPPIEEDRQIYGSEKPYPAKEYDYTVEKMGGTYVLKLNFYPFYYRGKENVLTVYLKTKFEIVLETNSSPLTLPPRNDYDRFIAQRLINKDAAFFGAPSGLVAQKLLPEQNVEDLIIDIETEDAAPESSSRVDLVDPEQPPGGGDGGISPAISYAVIVPQAYIADILPYVRSKLAEGILTGVVTLEEIMAVYAGADSTEKISNFLIDASNRWRISYCLLVGNEYLIPSGGRSDQRFGDLSGYLGFFLGRLSVFGDEIALASSRWIGFNSQKRSKSALLIPNSNPPNLDGGGLRLNQYLGGTNWNISGALDWFSIRDSINAGPTFISYHDHGWPNGWTGVSFDSDDVMSWANYSSVNAPFIVAGACATGYFEYNDSRFPIRDPENYSMGEAFLAAPGGGTIGYIGESSVVSWPVGAALVESFYQRVTDQWRQTGRILVGSVMSTRSNVTLSGDPTGLIDLLPATPDITTPIIDNSSVSIGPSPAIAGQQIEIHAWATDDDDIAYVWVQITKPDTTIINIEMPYSAGSVDYKGVFNDTVMVGEYAVAIYADDISKNETSLSGFSFQIEPDNEPPVIQQIPSRPYLTPASIYPGGRIDFAARISDNSGSVLVKAIITKPDSTQTEAVLSKGTSGENDYYGNYTNDALIGNYAVVIYAKDAAGNESTVEAGTFTVLADFAPPLIDSGWIKTAMWFPQLPRDSVITVTPQDTLFFYVAVKDDTSSAGNTTVWAMIEKPNGDSVRLNMFHIWETIPVGDPPVAFPVYRYEFFNDLSQLGTYLVTFYAEDLSHRQSSLAGISFTVAPLADTTPPTLNNKNPPDNQQDVPATTSISFNLNDEGSGVDDSSIILRVNGVVVTPTVNGAAPQQRQVNYTPPSPFQSYQLVSVEVSASDLAGNSMVTPVAYSFRIADNDPPYVASRDPAGEATNIPVNTSIAINVLDAGVGIDNSTIVMKVKGVTVSPMITGTPQNSNISYTPPAPFSLGETVLVQLDISDLSGNTMPSDSYSFSIQPPSGTGPFIESGGQVVIETEHFKNKIDRSSHYWQSANSTAGFVGDGYMNGLPDNGAVYSSSYTTTAPELQFEIKFSTPGTYYVWVRGRAPNGNGDSLYGGLDADAPSTLNNINFDTLGQWAWTGVTKYNGAARITVNVTVPTVKTFKVWMREDGLIIDRIILTKDASFNPGTSIGPPESPRL